MKKRWDAVMVFWCGAALAVLLGLEALLILAAVRWSGGFDFAWIFPILFPLALIALFVGTTRREKLMSWRYLSGYLPCVGMPILASLYYGTTVQLIVGLAFLPLQIGIPFWFGSK